MSQQGLECELINSALKKHLLFSLFKHLRASRRRAGSWRLLALWWVSGLAFEAGEEEDAFLSKWCLLVDQTECKLQGRATNDCQRSTTFFTF